MKKLKNFKPKGFTLIELLTAIFIIGILATIVIASTSYLRSKARDAKRTDDIDRIAKTLESYYADNHEYPAGDCGTGECYPDNKKYWDSMNVKLKSEGYIDGCLQDEKINLEYSCQSIPTEYLGADPIKWGYRYITSGSPAGSYTMITVLETDKGASGSIPSSGCSQGLPEGPEYRIKDGVPQPPPC